MIVAIIGRQNSGFHKLFPPVTVTVVNNLHKQGRSQVIHHKFLEPGHTHMETDSIHAKFEKAKKKQQFRPSLRQIKLYNE